MVVKIVTAAITLGLALVAIRHLVDRQERAKVKARVKPTKVTRLRRDPETGIYRPDE